MPVIQTYGDMDLWDIEAAHPWLRAIKALGDEFFEAGWYDDARDAGDNFGRIGPRLAHAV